MVNKDNPDSNINRAMRFLNPSRLNKTTVNVNEFIMYIWNKNYEGMNPADRHYQHDKLMSLIKHYREKFGIELHLVGDKISFVDDHPEHAAYIHKRFSKETIDAIENKTQLVNGTNAIDYEQKLIEDAEDKESEARKIYMRAVRKNRILHTSE